MTRALNITPNWALRLVLVSSYAYYHLDANLMPDETFDQMMGYLRRNFDRTTHEHRRLIRPGMFSTGSLFTLGEAEYPRIVASCACRLVGLGLDVLCAEAQAPLPPIPTDAGQGVLL